MEAALLPSRVIVCGRSWEVGWTLAGALGWLMRKEGSSGGEQTSVPLLLGSVVGLQLISDPFCLLFFDENSYVFSILGKVLSKLSSGEVPAPLPEGSPQRGPTGEQPR